MIVKINDTAVKAIESILKRGNDAIVYRNKSGIVVSEQTRRTVYRTVQRDEQDKGNQSQ